MTVQSVTSNAGGQTMRCILWVCSLFLEGAAMIAFLSGCATTMTPEQKAELEKYAAQQITCTEGDDCNVKWGKARTWVLKHSQWKIEILTDSIIQTYGPYNSRASAYVINKVPMGNRLHKITIYVTCNNLFGCTPEPLIATGVFNAFVLETHSQP